MRLFPSRKKLVAATGTIALVGAAMGVAFAYFTSTGTGTGSAQTGKASTLSISQVGAGYDSLNPTTNYSQDQCFSCVGITEFGNDITLANPGAQQLVNVVVAMHNWGAAITNLPITLTIYNTVNGPISDTENFSFPAATGGASPTEANITFNFAAQQAFVQRSFVYGITFDANASDTPNGSSLNVALSSSALNLSVGSDTNPGTVWLNTTDANLGGDFPSCSTPVATNQWEQVTTDGCSYSSSNPGAYGTPAQVAAGSADIPAVEVNVVGGIVPSLTPGGPAQPVDFAITNPGSSSVHVDTVTAAVGTISNAGTDPSIEACSASMYTFNNGTLTLNQTLPSGTSLFVPSGMSIQMADDNANQDNCQGALVNLSFSSN